jgi:hypothetical protein
MEPTRRRSVRISVRKVEATSASPPCCQEVKTAESKTLPKARKAVKQGAWNSMDKDGMTVTVWHDKRDVYFLSSIANPTAETSVLRKQKDGSRESVRCPLAVQVYGQHMGRVDKHNQLREMYPMTWRSHKWWHSLFAFMVSTAVTNAYILQKHFAPGVKLTHLKFLEVLSDELIGSEIRRTARGRPKTATVTTVQYAQLIVNRVCWRHV